MKICHRADAGLGFRQHGLGVGVGRRGGLHPHQRHHQRQAVGDTVIDFFEQRHRAVARLENLAVSAVLLAVEPRLVQRLLKRGQQLHFEIPPRRPDDKAGGARFQRFGRDLEFGCRRDVNDRRRLGRPLTSRRNSNADDCRDRVRG